MRSGDDLASWIEHQVPVPANDGPVKHGPEMAGCPGPLDPASPSQASRGLAPARRALLLGRPAGNLETMPRSM